MRTDRRKLMVSNRKNDMYELLGKALRFHPYINNSYSKFISSWDTSKVTDLSYCFQGCWISSMLDLSMLDFSSMINLAYAFSGTGRNISKLKLPELRDGNVLNSLYCTWYNNNGIQKLDLSKFNTKNVTNYGWIFYGSNALEWLDISGFDLTSATIIDSFFGLNKNLKHIVLGEGFGKIKKQGVTFDMSSFASLDEESKASFMSLYDRKANGLPNVTLKLKTSYGFSEEQIQSLTNKGYTINLV